MKDITLHITEHLKSISNTRVLESIGLEESINESASLTINDLVDLEPKQIRHEIVRILKHFLDKSGLKKEYKKLYDSMSIIEANKYPKHFLKVLFKNNDKAKKLLLPLVNAADKLHDYSVDYVNDTNKVFSDFQNVASTESKSILKNLDDEIKDIVFGDIDDSAVILLIVVWSNDLSNEYGFDTKKIKNDLKPLKKLYNDFKISTTKDTVTVEGTFKEYEKALENVSKKWENKVRKENK